MPEGASTPTGHVSDAQRPTGSLYILHVDNPTSSCYCPLLHLILPPIMQSPRSTPRPSSNLADSGLPIAAFYMLTAILLIYFNKAAFSYYNFSAPNLLTLSQSLCSLLLLSTARHYSLLTYQPFTLANFRLLVHISLSFVAYMVLGMLAMKLVSLPMYTTLRRTTVVFVMVIEYLSMNKGSSTAVKLSVAVMVVGAIVAGWKDMRFDLASYTIVFTYNGCTALYLVLINQISTRERQDAKQQHRAPLTQWDFMYYNNLTTIPLLAIAVLVTGETQSVLHSPYLSSPTFHLSLLASSLLAFVLNYAIFRNTAVNSALTQTVAGQAKDVVVVLLGVWAFEDGALEAGGVVGVVLGFLGSLGYAVAKAWQQPSQQQPAAVAVRVNGSNGSGSVVGGGEELNGLLEEDLENGEANDGSHAAVERHRTARSGSTPSQAERTL